MNNANASRLPRNFLISLFTYLFVFIICFVAAKLRFNYWQPKVFFGDDLVNYMAFVNGAFASSISKSLIVGSSMCQKYRPIFTLFMHFAFTEYGKNIDKYYLTNLLIQGVSATLVFACTLKLSSNNKFISLIIALVVAASRFALYQVVYVTGLVEDLGMLFFLASLYCYINADVNEDHILGWSWLGILTAFLAFFTHERYLGLILWWLLGIWFLFGKHSIKFIHKIVLLSFSASLLLYDILHMIFVLHIPLFMGTSSVKLGINLSTMGENIKEALLSILGLNYGPQYLVGIQLRSMHEVEPKVCAAGFAIMIIIVVGWRIRLAYKKAVNLSSFLQVIRKPLMLMMLISLLLIPPIFTIRMEQRWLLEPFILMLMIFSWAVCFLNKKLAWILVGLMGITSVGLDSFISPHFDQLYFISGEHAAEVVKKNIVDSVPSNINNIAIVADFDGCEWVIGAGSMFNGNSLFKLYKNINPNVYCVSSLNDVIKDPLPEDTRIYGPVTDSQYIDITKSWNAMVLAHRIEHVTYDFLSAYPNGYINSTQKVDTPTGTGVFTLPWNTTFGKQNSLTILSGFSYQYKNISVDNHAKLRVGIGMVNASIDPAKIAISIGEDGEPMHVIYSAFMMPPSQSGLVQFKPIVVSLASYASKKTTIKFSVLSAEGNQWVAFFNPRITN